MEITNLDLFYRYALPCGELGVELGVLDREKVDEVRNAFLQGHPLKEPEKVFPVAIKLLEITAKKLGKDCIDEQVLRAYFWNFHDEHVKEKALLIKGFPVKECMVWPAEMISDEEARTPIGNRKIKKLLLNNLNPGEHITIHHGYACEKISKEQFREMWKQRRLK